MDHAERLRRREQYRDRETPEEREIRLASRRQHKRRRYAALTLDQQRNSRRSTSQQLPTPQPSTSEPSNDPDDTNLLPSFDDPSIITKISQYHDELMSLAFNQFTGCEENFPTLKLNAAGICVRCHSDKHIPKLHSK